MAAAVVVGAIAAMDRSGWRVPVLRVAVIGLLQTATVMSLLYTGMRVLPAGTSALLLFTNLLWVAVMAAVLGECLSRSAVVGLLAGVAGVVSVLGGARLRAGYPDQRLASVRSLRVGEWSWHEVGNMASGGIAATPAESGCLPGLWR